MVMRRVAGMLLWAVLLLGLTGCGEPVWEPETLVSGDVELSGCATVRGTVLDASSRTLFLRADDGNEYVFSLLGATVKVEDRLKAEQYVDVYYRLPGGETDLRETNSKRAQVEYICQADSKEKALTR